MTVDQVSAELETLEYHSLPGILTGYDGMTLRFFARGDETLSVSADKFREVFEISHRIGNERKTYAVGGCVTLTEFVPILPRS